MRILQAVQAERIQDPVRSKLAMVAPILEGTLHSLALDRIARFGGIDRVTLADLAREFRAGDGDSGICFEYAVHEAIGAKHPLIHPLASEVLEKFCGIGQGAQSILFGPEKDGRIPILESVQNALTDESRLYVGNRGQPPKLKKYIPQIVRAFRLRDERANLPRSITGVWKADLFVGNAAEEGWVGTTVKSNAANLEGAQGLRIGIYPQTNERDRPRRDDKLNLIRLPLPYDGAFMEFFFKAFFLVGAFLRADAVVPPPIALPDAEDRFITTELERRRQFEVVQLLPVIRAMSQEGLLHVQPIADVAPSATLSENTGLTPGAATTGPGDPISIAPKSLD